MSSLPPAFRSGLSRRLLAEAVGSALLAATVVGSGIMAERLAGGNTAIALLANSLATVAVLGVIIKLFAPVSGAHFNPAVTLVEALQRRLAPPTVLSYVTVQVAGCCAGAMLAHAMFELPPLQMSTHARTGLSQWLAEFVATFGLLLVILGHRGPHSVAWLVAAWIGAAYWFTASTSFANPAITLARSLTDTFSGIRAADTPFFIAAQLAGAAAALATSRALFPHHAASLEHSSPRDEASCTRKRGL